MITDLAKEWLITKGQIDALTKQKKQLELAMFEQTKDKIELDANYGTGSRTITEGEYKIKISVPKKVDWDAAQLAVVCESISETGDDYRQYVDVKLSVSETKYNAWPDYIRTAFEPARTVSAGNPSITIEEAK